MKGEAYVGDAAWKHLEAKSGPTMATFVEKYVRQPITSLDKHAETLLDLAVKTKESGKEVSFTLTGSGNEYQWTVARAERPELATDAESDD